MEPVMNQMYNPYGGPPPLPPGWIEYRAPTGQPYWYNTFTRQSSWALPIYQHVPKVIQPIMNKKKQIKKKIPGTCWLFVITPDGYEFYYDRENKKSVWEMPEELKEGMEQLRQQEEEEKEKKKRQLQEEQEQEVKRIKLEHEQEMAAKKLKLEQEQKEKSEEKIEEEKEESQEQKSEEPNETEFTEMTEEDMLWQLEQMGEMRDIEEEPEQEQEPERALELETTTIIKEEENINTLTDEKIEKLYELLNERNISPFSVYSVEYPKLMTDSRFSCIPHNKQKGLFNKYCNELGEKIKEEKKKIKKPEDEFKELLESKVTTKMYWDDFRRKYKNDPRFNKGLLTKEKETLFKEHVKHNLNKKKSPKEDYIELLRSTKEIREGIRWRDAKRILEKDQRYFAIESKTEREDLFRDYLEELK